MKILVKLFKVTTHNKYVIILIIYRKFEITFLEYYPKNRKKLLINNLKKINYYRYKV